MSFWRRRRSIEELFDEIMREFEDLFWGLEREMIETFERGGVRPIVYGVRITIGPDGRPIVEEFGNVRRIGRRPVISEEREPLVEVHEEDNKVTVIAELPGVDKEDIDVRVVDNKLIIKAKGKDRKYYKEVELPEDIKPETARAQYRNGVLEVTIERKKPKIEIEEEKGIRVKIE